MLRFFGLLLLVAALLGSVSAQTAVGIDLAGASFYSSSGATMTQVSLGAGQPSTVALRVNVPVTTGNVWDNGINIQTTLPSNVAAGDWFLMKFSARQVSGQANFPVGKGIQAIINIRPFNGGYVNSLDATLPCDSTSWCDYAIAFRANEAQTNANPPYIMFQMSEGPQTFDIAVTSLTYYGTTQPPASLYKFYYPGRDVTTASWRTSANTRIDNIRKGDLNVKVVDANNNPITGATVRVEQQRHEYRFGVAINHWLVVGGTNPTYNSRILQYFNHIALENGLKMVYWENDNGASAISALQWASANSLSVTGHVLLWGEFSGDYMPQDTWTMTAAQLRPRILNHVSDIVTRTKAYVSEWDVVNEPLENNDVQGTVLSTGVAQTNGVLGNSFPAELFNYTYSLFQSGANPQTPSLFVNDYSVMEGLDLTRRTYTANFTKYAKQRSPYVNGYGFQSHVGQYLIPVDVLQSRLDYLLGVDPAFTAAISELDIATYDEELHADYLEDYMTFFFSQQRIKHITQWGFWEGSHYNPICALWRQNWQPKPAGTRYLDLVFNRWWTNATATTSSAGTAALRAFYGRHQVTASFNGVTKSVAVTLSSTAANGQTVIQLNTVVASASPAAPSPTRTPTSSPTRTPTPAAASPTRTPTPAAASPTRTPTPAAASPTRSPTRSPSPAASTTTTTGPHSLSAYTATPGSTITVNTKVNVGSTAITNGYVGYYIAPAGDYGDEAAIASGTVSATLAAGSSTPFAFSAALAAGATPGQYWLTVAVWDSNWNNIAWNTNLATLTVYPPSPTINPVDLSPTAVFPGGQTTVTFTVNTANTAYTNAFIGYSFAPRGQTANKLVEDFYSGSGNLAARSVTSYTFTATIPANAAPGNYDLNAGVWDSAWNGVAYSGGINSGVVLTVRNPAASVAAGSISASTVARGGSVTIVVNANAGASALASARVGYSVVPSASANTPVVSTQTNNNVNVAAGATGAYTFVATIPTSAATGQYRVTLGLWDVNWNSLDWVNNGFYINVV